MVVVQKPGPRWAGLGWLVFGLAGYVLYRRLVVRQPLTVTLRAPVIMAEPYGTRLAWHRTLGAWAAVQTSTGRTGWMLRALLRPA